MDIEDVSLKIMELAEMFDDCPPMQAMLHGIFTLYLSGERGLVYLVLLAASMKELLETVRDDV